MKQWSFVLLSLYFLFILTLAFIFNVPREVTRPWFWIWTGGLILTTALGAYFDGSASQEELVTIGAFTLLWLGLAFIIPLQTEYFSLLGLIIELILVILVRKLTGG